MSSFNAIVTEELQRIIMDNTAMWLNVLDKDAKVVMWNKAAEMISGYSQQEVLGKSNIWELLYPDEAYRNSIYAKALAIINQGKEVIDLETTIRCKDGGRRILSWNSHDIKNADGEVIGSLALARDITELHDNFDKLKALTSELELSNQQLQLLSAVDPLTGLYNRRSMEKILQEEWDRHARNAEPLSLLYIDIDFFKQYNDAYGHLLGDEILIELAKTFNLHARRSVDKAFRFGGEEFAIILPQTNSDEATRIARKLRSDIENKKIKHSALASIEFVTVSVGVTTAAPSPSGSPQTMKIQADQALYKAKDLGRNRVETIGE